MADVDKIIRNFLLSIGTKYTISRPALDEIEDHIRLEYDDLIAAGKTSDIAISQVLANFGIVRDLSVEFAKLTGEVQVTRLRNLLSHIFNGRIIMRLFLGTFLGVFFIIGGMLLEGGQIASITQITAFLIVLGGALGGVMVTYPIDAVKNAAVLALTGRNAVSDQYLTAARVFRSFGDMAMYSGAIGFALGLIHVFDHIQRFPDSIGPGMAVAVVSILYALFTKLFIGRALSDSFFLRAQGNASRPNGSKYNDLEAA